MCIAIPPPLRSNRSIAHGGWHWLSSQALRLLGLAALLQALALGHAAVTGSAGGLLAMWLPLSSLLLGLAMQTLPLRLYSLPIGYAQRVLIFAAVTAGGLLIALGKGLPTVLGTGLLATGWLSAWRVLRWKLHWAHGRVPMRLRIGFHGLELLAFGLFLLLVGRLL